MTGLFDDTTQYAEVLIPLSIPGTFTYRVPLELNDEIANGKRVMVQFGRKKVYSGLVVGLHNQPPSAYQAKYVLAILDDTPIVPDVQIRFWHWLAEYYLCHLGEVMSAALPSSLKMESQSKIMLRETDYDQGELDRSERSLLEQLSRVGELTIDQAEKLTASKGGYKIIHSLFTRGLIWINVELSGGYTAKSQSFVSLDPRFREDQEREKLTVLLGKRAVMQHLIVQTLIERDPHLKGIERREFLNTFNLSPSAMKLLIEKGIVLEKYRDVSRFEDYDESDLQQNLLSPVQEQVLQQIKTAFQQHDVCLLQGVTASGKTHVYIRLIEEVIASGRQVLYLLPEISLTTQLIRRLQAYFGNKVMVTHSRFNANERAEIWYRILDGSCRILLAPRSGIFMPFSDLGLIVVDEEHESSYKQHEPNPRYHARDAALVLAQYSKAKVLLGSATPSLESYRNARSGKYAYVRMDDRWSGITPPRYQIVDMREERRLALNRGIFSHVLLEVLGKNKQEGMQSILFLNRKGYVPTTECSECSWTPKCIHCDISLTYYRKDHCLRCHFCGYQTEPFKNCPACGGTDLRMEGYGTERVENELNRYMSDIQVHRFDQLTARTRRAYEMIIRDFEDGKTDVLIGTQMLTKGLDFSRVSLVAILDADQGLNFPDFRAYERSFQQMIQVGGRAGRRDIQGLVLIQTNQPSHRIISQVVDYNYDEMVRGELHEREKFQYPPFIRLIRIAVKHEDSVLTEKAADRLCQLLKPDFGDLLLGPQEPHVSRIRGLFIRHLLLKMPEGKNRKAMKNRLFEMVQKLRTAKEFAKVRFILDVDPA